VTCCACEACRGQAFWLDGPVERPCFECKGTRCTHGEGCIEDHTECAERHTPCPDCGACIDLGGWCESDSCYCATHEAPLRHDGSCIHCQRDDEDGRGDWLRAEAKDEAAIAARGGS
jgi:hypothetical protein